MFTRTSLTPLAREPGVSKAAIYRYFPGKDNIIDTMEEYFARELMTFLSRNPGFIRFFISRLYHQYRREPLPFGPIVEKQALLLQERSTAAEFDKRE